MKNIWNEENPQAMISNDLLAQLKKPVEAGSPQKHNIGEDVEAN